MAEDPFPDGLPTQPDVCDGQNPSEDCFKAMADQGGYLWFDKDSQCSDTQKGQLKTALWGKFFSPSRNAIQHRKHMNTW